MTYRFPPVFRTLLALLSALFGTATLHAGAHAVAEKSGADWPHQQSDVPVDPAVTWDTLPNGMRVVLMPWHEPPGRISLRLYVNAGSLNESDTQEGLAHFLEHMAFNGTENFAAGEMVEVFQRLGMGFGAHTNAYTSYDRTVYMLELPENSDEIIDESLTLMRDYAAGMLLEEEEIEAERGVILSEKRTRDSPEFRTYKAELGFILPDSLISRRIVIGEEEDIREAGRDEFVDYYQNWYTPDRMAIVAVGDLDPEAFTAKLAAIFGDFERPRNPDPDLGWAETVGVQAMLHTEPEAKDTTVSLQVVKRHDQDPDTRSERTEDIRIALANAILDRRLEILAKKEGAPILSGKAYSWEWLEFMRNSGIEVTTQPGQWKEALAVAEQELRRAMIHGFTEAEFDEAAAKMRNAAEEAVRTASTRKSRGIAGGLISAISSDTVFTTPETDLAILEEALAETGPAELAAALKAAWAIPGLRVFVSGNLELEDAARTILAALGRSRAVKVDPPVAEEAVAFAYSELPPAADIVDRQYHEDLDVTQVRLANGVRINLKPTDFEAETIRITTRIGGGQLQEPSDLPGLANFVSGTFSAGGLEAHSADEIERIMAGRTVGVSFAVRNDAFAMGGRTNPADLGEQLRLMRAYLIAPGYRQEAVRQFHKSLDPMYVQLRQTPDGVMADQVSRFLADGDPRFGYPEKEILLSRTMGEARSWLAPILETAYLELSLVGDFDVGEALEAVRQVFGSLPDRDAEKPAFAEARKASFPVGAEDHTFTYPSEIPKSIAAVTWPTEDIWDISRTRRLSVLSEAFSDRLRIKIREEIGEAYSPYATHRPSDTFEDYGYFMGLVIADPEQTESLQSALRTIAADLHADGIDQDELARAIKPLLNDLEEWRRNNNYWLNNVIAASQEYPQRLNWSRSMYDDFASITVEEVNALARTYLDPEKSVAITVTPE